MRISSIAPNFCQTKKENKSPSFSKIVYQPSEEAIKAIYKNGKFIHKEMTRIAKIWDKDFVELFEISLSVERSEPRLCTFRLRVDQEHRDHFLYSVANYKNLKVNKQLIEGVRRYINKDFHPKKFPEKLATMFSGIADYNKDWPIGRQLCCSPKSAEEAKLVFKDFENQFDFSSIVNEMEIFHPVLSEGYKNKRNPFLVYLDTL